MSISKDIKKYSKEQNINYNDFLNFIGLVELRHKLKTIEVEPNPSSKTKEKVEDLWGKDIQNGFTNILEKYKKHLNVYNFIKKQEKFSIYISLKKITDKRIKLLTVEEDENKDDSFISRIMSRKTNEDILREEELNELKKVAFKDPFLISELQTYYIVEEILNRGFYDKDEYTNEYIDFKTNEFEKIQSTIRYKKHKVNPEKFIQSLKENASEYTVEMYCKEHDNLFCKACYYSNKNNEISMIEFMESKKDVKELSLYKLLDIANTPETSEEYYKVLEEIKSKLRMRFMI